MFVLSAQCLTIANFTDDGIVLCSRKIYYLGYQVTKRGNCVKNDIVLS